MFKLLNRFAWIIALSFSFQLSFLVDRNGPFDEEGFFMFIFSFIVIRFFIISKKFIESRLEYFAEALNGRNIKEQNVASSVLKEEKTQQIKEPKINTTENIELNIEEQINHDIVQKTKKIKEVKKEVKKEPSKIAIYIKQFFSENILAKLGVILVFLGVLFLMSLIWNQIPQAIKIIMGFIIGFGTYFAGVYLDSKGYTGESKILIGAGILINYLVILAGKHLTLGNYGEGVAIGTAVAFIFLILNTVFAIVTSYVYKSRTLLIFSFIFAYLNPLLIGGNSDTPYLLIGYSIIVSLGALFIGYKNNDNILKYSAFILGNILFLIAPIGYNLSIPSQEIAWIIKMLFTGLLGFLSILAFYKNNGTKISSIFILNYVFIILQLIGGGNIGIFNSSIGFITYMLSILMFFFVGIWLFKMESMKTIIPLLVFPIIIILGILIVGGLNFVVPALAIVVLSYLIGFSFLGEAVSSFSKYFFFIILGGFIFVTNVLISYTFIDIRTLDIIFDFNSFLISIIVSFVFLFSSYYFSIKEKQEYLYSIGTIGGIFTLVPVITVGLLLNEPFNSILDYITIPKGVIITSIISVIVFALANQLLPFINNNLIRKANNIKNLIIGSVFGILFIGFELFMFGNSFFPGITLGFAFVGLAILYFVLGFLMMNKLGVNNVKKEMGPKNSILSYLFISISLFSLAVALVFSNNPEVISTIWLFEASILFYFFSKTKENKIFGIGLLLFIIGIFNLFDLHNVVNSKDFIFLIPFTIIGTSLVFNLKNLNSLKLGFRRVSHDILHIIGVGVLGSLLIEIIPSTGHGWSLLGISIFVFIIGLIYSYFSSKILKIFFVIVLGGFMLLHLGEFNSIIRRIDNNNLSYLRILQYISTIILTFVVVGWNKINKKSIIINNIINVGFVIYLFLIISEYVLDIFGITFAVTIFWGIVSSIFLFYGISSDKIKYRTIGLYLLTVILTKIFIYDIWYGLDDAITRVVAFIGIGILLIVISTRYTKKYGNNLKGEFSLGNLSDEKVDDKINNKKEVNKKSNSNKETKIPTKTKKIKEFVINEKIKDIDVSNIKLVKFIFAGKSINIRAVNLLKIVKLIINNFNGKTSFKPGELKQVYDYIKTNYKSDLSRDNYNKIIDILEGFVDNGGDVKLIEK